MNRVITRALALSLAAGLLPLGAAAQGQAPATSVTIYSSSQPGGIPASMYRPAPGGSAMYYGQPLPGYATVRQSIALDLQAGMNEVRLTDVAALIDPTTVSLSTDNPRGGLSVLDQNYQFDLVAPEKVLERFIDREIGVVIVQGNSTQTVRGTLLSSQGGQIILRGANGTVQVLNGYSSLDLPPLEDGLVTRPTLVWSINADQAGPQQARVAYQTEGITWWADYNLQYNDGADENRGTVDIGAWVSILNRSGASYDNAQLKLVAGDVNRIQPPETYPYAAMSRGMAMEDARAGGFQQKAFFEYHLYTLGRRATIPQNSTKQIELFPVAEDVPCEKVLVFDGAQMPGWWGGGPIMDEGYGAQSKKEVDVYLKFVNSEESGLGIPLPAGRVRVNREDEADRSLEFIGEDVLKHTPRNEEVLVRLGNSFDLVGERRQVSFELDTSRRVMEETIEVTVRNRKDKPVEVVVQERLFRWSTAEVVKASQDAKRLDASTLHFPVRVNPDEEAHVQYTVRYTW